MALWQPITAICKFVRDGKYETSEGDTKVQCRKNKRYTDLAASRGELIEVSIEAVFEPMVQGKDFCKILVLIFWILHPWIFAGYIIFPSIISIIQRLAQSIKINKNGFEINFSLSSIESAQLVSIVTSIVSLAWCFSEYNSVRKNMLLDVTVSPCSRAIMWFFMLIQVVARLLAFMLFTLFW